MNTPGQREIWQRLLGLESRETVQQRFEKIHARKLNVRRAAEISASVRQAREYFRNANASDYSVRPLLTFYGIACLGRALSLLMKPKGGEEGLTAGHGLQTAGWRNVMSGNVADAMKKFEDLKIVRRSGLFSDFLVHVRNSTLLYHRSGATIGPCVYNEPDHGVEISLGDLFSRIPDLCWDYLNVSNPQYADVSEFSNSAEKGFEVKLVGDRASFVADVYEELGYAVARDGECHSITCDSSTLSTEPPMFVHNHVHKMIDAIPLLHRAIPFHAGARFSELCIAFILSYALRMLVRYYPTHWITLINGGQGDLLWPTVNRAQHYVESIFPELVSEYVAFAMDNPEWVAKGQTNE